MSRNKVLCESGAGSGELLITSILGKSNEAQNQANTISQRELASNCAILIVAESETSASLLSGLTYYMLKNPPAYEKLEKEIRESFQSYNDINFQAVSTLPYLNAVVEEILRCYPPVSGIQPRIVPKGGVTIDGEIVPEGTSFFGAHYSTYHAASHFTEPDSFIPERWLETREKRFESDNRSAMVPFSLGPRNCIRRNFGYAEMRLIVAKMTWSFDMTLDMSSDKWNFQKSFGFWQKSQLLVHLTKHNAKA
ncbi:Cytochrome monooxygenase lcsI [Penicillium malachiteum]|nr:Cytochrome monooxygenase lcsI [Penicillium malachiteum]